MLQTFDDIITSSEEKYLQLNGEQYLKPKIEYVLCTISKLSTVFW